MKVTTLFCAVAVTLAACGQASSPNPTAPSNPTVTAIVVTSASATASASFQVNASARLTNGTTTDITQVAVWQSSNTQIASVSTTGYVTVVSNGSVDLKASYQGLTASTHVTIALPATYTLSGGVYDMATGRPIPGARVELLGGSGGFTMTDASGAFSMAVPNGRILVEASKDGYQPDEPDITVSGNATLTIPMTPAH